jgi:hypothetical protein
MMRKDPESLQNPQQTDATACKLAAKRERKGCVRIAFSFRRVTGRGGAHRHARVEGMVNSRRERCVMCTNLAFASSLYHPIKHCRAIFTRDCEGPNLPQAPPTRRLFTGKRETQVEGPSF